MRFFEYFPYVLITASTLIFVRAVTAETWSPGKRLAFGIAVSAAFFLLVGFYWLKTGEKPDETAMRAVICTIAPSWDRCHPGTKTTETPIPAPDHTAAIEEPSPPRHSTVATNTVGIQLDIGTLMIRLRPDLAPQHVERVKRLISEGFYDGLKFHRVVPGFIAQTGDPTATGRGGSNYPDIPAEFTDTPMRKGSVGAARTTNPNSANSQFFICLDDDACKSLEGLYTVWGQVVGGMDVLDKIATGEPPPAPTVMRNVYLMSNNR